MQPHQQQRRPFARRPATAPRQPRPEPPTLDELAGQAARRIIRDAGLPDTVENWRSLREAALAGLEELRGAGADDDYVRDDKEA
jgi:hypothetical protein